MGNSDITARKLFPAEALQLQHDDIRAGLVTASMEQGAVGDAAKRLNRLCIRHFEQEEKHLFPVLALVLELALDDVKPEMAAVLPLVSRFSLRHDRLHNQQKSIVAAVEALIAAARKDGNRHVAEFAHQLWLHERVEETILYPTVILVGKYIRDRLGIGPRKDPDALATGELGARWARLSGTIN